MTNTEKLLTPDEVADWLKVTRRWVIGSQIPAVRLGRKRRYRACDIIAYTAANRSFRQKPE